MDPRVLKLIDTFENNGWTLQGSIDFKNDWWFEDIILLSSKLQPVDIKLYLTLLTDPQDMPKKTVWSINFSSNIPKDKTFNLLGHITLNDINKTDLISFVKKINAAILNNK